MDDQFRAQISDFVINFTSILWEAMPFIVLGAVIAGILEELLPQEAIGKLIPKNPLAAALIGGGLGLIFPMCECGIVVVMRRLLRKGLPLSSCIAYMLGGPIVNVIVLLSTFVAFGGIQNANEAASMVALRAGLGYTIAVLGGCAAGFMQARWKAEELLKPLALPPAPSKKSLSLTMVDDTPQEPEVDRSFFKRLGRISDTTLHDFIDITVFLILGAVIASFVKMNVTPQDIQSLSTDQPYLAIPAMMFLAVVMCLCSEADAFVAASFTEMTLSAKLAFLVLGPMLDLKLLLMFTRVFRTRLIIMIVACTVAFTGLFTMIVHVAADHKPSIAPTIAVDKKPATSTKPTTKSGPTNKSESTAK